VRDAVAIALASVGLLFSLSGIVGILRMPDLYTRVQCSTKNVTMGSIPVLLAVVVAKGPLSPYGSRSLLVAFLLFILNPVASHALTRAAYKAGVEMWPGSVVDVARDRISPGDRSPDR
jgi:multicomponent Na+:H+ antiporter subunit G